MTERKSRELYIVIDDTPEAIAAATAEIRRLPQVWGVGSVPLDGQEALMEAYVEYKKLVELASGDKVMVSQSALDNAERLVMMAAHVAQAESLGKLADALSDGNIDYFIGKIIRELGATR